jgi:outer membrane protein OmpA-like peptidoglycan-associated protein
VESRGFDGVVAGERKMQKRLLALTLAAGLVALGGCATKPFVRHQVGEVDTKLQGTQSQVDTQGQHLTQLDATTQDALNRANAAGKLAEGKFLYSMVLSDDSVKFPTDGSQLSPEAETRLTDLANKLKADNRNVYLEIQGHTDNRGPKTLNMQLGEQRAEAVRLFMNKQGVALNRMATISYGDTVPVAPNETRTGRAQNRRVVLVVLD